MDMPEFDPLTGERVKMWVFPKVPTDLNTLLMWAQDDQPALYLPALRQLIQSYPLAEETKSLLQTLARDPEKGVVAFGSIGTCEKKELLDLCLQIAFSETSHPLVQASALEALCRLNADLNRHRADLSRYLSAPELDLRLAAATALARLGVVKGWRMLLQNLKASRLEEQILAINFLTECLRGSIPPPLVESGVVHWLESSSPLPDGTDLYLRKRLLTYLWQYPLREGTRKRLKHLLQRWYQEEQQRCQRLFRVLRFHLLGQPYQVGGGWLLPYSRHSPFTGNKDFAEFLETLITNM